MDDADKGDYAAFLFVKYCDPFDFVNDDGKGKIDMQRHREEVAEKKERKREKKKLEREIARRQQRLRKKRERRSARTFN